MSIHGDMLEEKQEEIEHLTADVHRLREAIRLTREYVGERMLPAREGWTWFEAIKATGGLAGFDGCGCVLDPQVHGRATNGELLYCTLPADHDGDHGIRADAA